MFNQFDESVPVTLMGGETGETIWDIFYRRTEFWLVAVLFGGLYFWVMDRYVTGDDWWNAIVHIAAGMMTMIARVFVSSFLLTRRQMLLDDGRTPFFERFERHVGFRLHSKCYTR